MCFFSMSSTVQYYKIQYTVYAHLNVYLTEAPKFDYDENQQVQRLGVGDKWHVPIQVIGHPRPSIRWTRNDKALVVRKVRR